MLTMKINEVPELRDELNIESVAELNPEAMYVFRFKGYASPEVLKRIAEQLNSRGIKAIVIDDSVSAIYKLER